jgi:hypothetical protein
LQAAVAVVKVQMRLVNGSAQVAVQADTEQAQEHRALDQQQKAP